MIENGLHQVMKKHAWRFPISAAFIIIFDDATICRDYFWLTTRQCMSETTLISVRVPKDVAKRLAKLADATERSKSYVAGQAIEEFLTLQEWQVKAIREGIAQADAGKLSPHGEAVKRLKRWGQRGDRVDRGRAARS